MDHMRGGSFGKAYILPKPRRPQLAALHVLEWEALEGPNLASAAVGGLPLSLFVVATYSAVWPTERMGCFIVRQDPRVRTSSLR